MLAFLFADMEGSTRLLHRLGDEYATVLAGYREVLEEAVAAGGGRTVDTQGDGHFAAFPSASGAIEAAVTAQRRLAEREWPQGAEVRARMGLHAGEVLATDGRLVGLEIHRAARIAAAAHGGQILVTSSLRSIAGDSLPADGALRDLGLHRFKDLAEPERVFQIEVSGLRSDFPTIRSLERGHHNLPVQLTSFHGRRNHLAAVKERLGDHRLVTLTGIGGSGKSRLALQAAADELDGFAGGVWLVELAPLVGGADVAPAVAVALGVRERADTDLVEDTLDRIGSRHTLVVLDNCEHVVESAAEFAARALRRCPGLRILATSRRPLGVPGEAVWPVPPFAVDDPEGAAAAVSLFLARAALVRPDFAPDDRELAAVREICVTLDGLPLAIELAAARMRMFGVAQIAARLGDRFRLLVGGQRGGLAHHQTLQAAMDWSYELLAPEAREVLARLSVFAGSFTLEAAEHVAAGGAVGGPEVTEAVEHLLEASLVHREGHRLGLLETVREYGAAALDAQEAARVAERHARYHATLVTGGGSDLGPEDFVAFLETLDAELDNLNAALGWAFEAGQAGLAVALVGGLVRYWYRRGYFRVARRWLAELERLPPQPPSGELAAAHRLAAAIAMDSGDEERARSYADLAEEESRRVGDAALVARALNLRAGIAWRVGALAEAAGLYEAALAELASAESPFRTQLLVNLALVRLPLGRLDGAAAALAELEAAQARPGMGVADIDRVRGELALAQGRHDDAARHFGAAVEALRELRLLPNLAGALGGLARAARAAGDPDLARRAVREAVEVDERMEDPFNRAEAQLVEVALLAEEGRAADARALLVQCLDVLGARGATEALALALTEAAGLLADDRPDDAAHVLEAGVAIRQRLGLVPYPAERERLAALSNELAVGGSVSEFDHHEVLAMARGALS